MRSWSTLVSICARAVYAEMIRSPTLQVMANNALAVVLPTPFASSY